MEPLTTATTTWTIAKTAAEVSRQLYEFSKKLKDRDLKQQIDVIADSVRELKQSASQLEDENRQLREKLRFKSDEYEFRSPFRYHKTHPEQPLCVKCFAKNIEGPVRPIDSISRECLVCGEVTYVRPTDASGFYGPTHNG